MKDFVMNFKEDPKRAELQAIRVLSLGDIAILPTDTVYGLHALATFQVTSSRLARLKGYEAGQRSFILLARDLDEVGAWAELSDDERALIEQYSPGAVTWICRARSVTPPYWLGELEGRPTVAFRIPDHAFLQCLLHVLPGPLFSTSANRAGQGSLESADEIAKLFEDKVKLVVSDPDLEAAMARDGASVSTLVDLSTGNPRVLREGKVNLSFGAGR
jgi:L-threonylcarbamoyladenylate synthase